MSEVEITVVDPEGEEARFCLSSYYAELAERFEEGFDPGESSAPDAAVFREPSGAFLVARGDGQPVGCGAIKYEADGTATIKRMWVSPRARGLGLGRRLLSELEGLARGRGIGVVRLDTNRALTEAIALYRSAGYVGIDRFNDERYAHHWFEKRL
ncbi:MAG: GNAT family N-acetyltransferase [Actinomycetes bacterium]|jgi:ribosomal protein S18 acetylase RimI-like enzyme|nr:MAG: hypothetical protein DIU67_09680 [Actinomycetota bacterium]